MRNTTVVPPPKTPEEGYHLSEDLADDAIGWLRNHQAFQADKPFFMYWASGCLHGPHHIMKEWADKYAGKFDDGWDAYRERVFERAKEKGWIPPDCELTARHETMAAWDSIPEDEKPFQRRLMEVAAGFAEHVDVQVGRLVDELERLGYGDNTLIFYIWGDNGSSGEGQNGTISELLAQNGIPTTTRMHIDALDELGGLDALGSPKTDNQYHAGWAWAGSTPYKGMKLLASHLGGTRNPMAIRWPDEIKPGPHPAHSLPPLQRPRADHLRRRRHHAAAARQRRAAGPDRRRQLRLHVHRPEAPGGKKTQYFEVMGSRSIYHDGWMASALGPRLPWVPGLPPGIHDWTPDNDRWELYHLDEDWTQAHDLAAEMPEKLAQMHDLFLIEAARNHVLPIGGGLWVPSSIPSCASHRRTASGSSPAKSPACPSSAHPRWETSPTSSPSTPTSPPTPTGCSTSSAATPAGSPASSTTAILCYEYNLFIIQRTKIRRRRKLPAGRHDRGRDPLRRARPGGPLDITMRVDGEVVAEGEVPVSAPLLFTANDCLDIGIASARPSRSTTTTRRRSPSTATSSASASHTPDPRNACLRNPQNWPQQINAMLRPRGLPGSCVPRRHRLGSVQLAEVIDNPVIRWSQVQAAPAGRAVRRLIGLEAPVQCLVCGGVATHVSA